jgi:D-glycero-D-manno-heptose 1,7-bisphosphate phosphatase
LNKIAFLDRDGVLNEDLGYVFRVEQFTWTLDAKEAIRWLNEQGYKVAVVTNQSGIGRGMYSDQEFKELMDWMKKDAANHGARIDAVYYCPHYPDSDMPEYRLDCECRKPKPGMILKGIADLDGDPALCFFLGDQPTDMQAAEAAGIQGFLYEGGSLLAVVRRAAETAR